MYYSTSNRLTIVLFRQAEHDKVHAQVVAKQQASMYSRSVADKFTSRRGYVPVREFYYLSSLGLSILHILT